MKYVLVQTPTLWLLCRLTEMLKDYRRIVDAIPPVLLPLMKPFCRRVDDAIKPGLDSLTWTSLNIDGCMKQFHLRRSVKCSGKYAGFV